MMFLRHRDVVTSHFQHDKPTYWHKSASYFCSGFLKRCLSFHVVGLQHLLFRFRCRWEKWQRWSIRTQEHRVTLRPCFASSVHLHGELCWDLQRDSARPPLHWKSQQEAGARDQEVVQQRGDHHQPHLRKGLQRGSGTKGRFQTVEQHNFRTLFEACVSGQSTQSCDPSSW